MCTNFVSIARKPSIHRETVQPVPPGTRTAKAPTTSAVGTFAASTDLRRRTDLRRLSPQPPGGVGGIVRHTPVVVHVVTNVAADLPELTVQSTLEPIGAEAKDLRCRTAEWMEFVLGTGVGYADQGREGTGCRVGTDHGRAGRPMRPRHSDCSSPYGLTSVAPAPRAAVAGDIHGRRCLRKCNIEFDVPSSPSAIRATVAVRTTTH